MIFITILTSITVLILLGWIFARELRWWARLELIFLLAFVIWLYQGVCEEYKSGKYTSIVKQESSQRLEQSCGGNDDEAILWYGLHYIWNQSITGLWR